MGRKRKPEVSNNVRLACLFSVAQLQPYARSCINRGLSYTHYRMNHRFQGDTELVVRDEYMALMARYLKYVKNNVSRVN